MVGVQKEGTFLKIRTWVALGTFLFALVIACSPSLISYGRDTERLKIIETKALKHDSQIEMIQADLTIIKAQLAVQTEILKRIERDRTR